MSNVKKIRETKGLKQEDIAKVIGTSPVNYSKKENGYIKFSLNEAKLLSDFYQQPIEVIFFDDEVSKIET